MILLPSHLTLNLLTQQNNSNFRNKFCKITIGHHSSRTDSAFSSDMSYSDETEHQLNPEAKAFEPNIEMKEVNSNQVSDLDTHDNIELWRKKSMGDSREELKLFSSYKMMSKEELEKITFRPKLRK